jgi:hypothetical protein
VKERVLLHEPVPAQKVGRFFSQTRGLAAELSQSRFRIISGFPIFKLVPLLDVPIEEIELIEAEQAALSIRSTFIISLRHSAWNCLFKSRKPQLWINNFRQLGIKVAESESFQNRSNGLLGIFRQ